MININPNLLKSLESNVSNYYVAYHITNNDKTYYLSTYPFTLPLDESGDAVFWNDLVMKTGNIKESIDLRTKKIKLSGTTLTINNANQEGQRFSDTIEGEMHGASVDAYLITPDCTYVKQGVRLSSLSIVKIKHDELSVVLTCDDKYIDEYHKELPLEENTLYEGQNTFAGDNEKRIPILYGHLKHAPAVAYIRNSETESAFIDNNVLILPDKAHLTTGTDNEYDIIGIRPISPYTLIESRPNQLIHPKCLYLGLGDGFADVYSNKPDRVNKWIVEGNPLADDEFESKWISQFEVSEDGNYINLLTDSMQDNSPYISSGHLLCGEVSRLINVNTHKVRVWRHESTEFGAATGLSLKHYTEFNTSLNSSSPNPNNYDMLGLPAFIVDDMSSETGDIENGVRLEINTQKYLTFLIDSGVVTPDITLGTQNNFDIITIELEFESLKSSADKSTGAQRETFTDANIVGQFKKEDKAINYGNITHSECPYWIMGFVPQQGTQKGDEGGNIPYYEDASSNSPDGYINVSQTILGIPSYSTNRHSSPFDEDYDSEGDWDDYASLDDSVGNNLERFIMHLTSGSPVVVSNYYNGNQELNTDYRHTFHSTAQDSLNAFANTWRVSKNHVHRTDFTSQNVWTGLFFPYVDTQSDGIESSNFIDQAVKLTFGGMSLRRSWYQQESFKNKFFVNAKGKYATQENDLLDDYPRHMYVENLSLIVSSDADDTLEQRETQDYTLFNVIDYLTKDRFEYYNENGKEYKRVLSVTNAANEIEMLLYDIDIIDLKTQKITDAGIDYNFTLNAKIFRFVSGSTFWDYDDNDYAFDNLSIEYARPIRQNNTNIINNWSFLEQDENTTGTPFTWTNPETLEIVNTQSIPLGYNPSSNQVVHLWFSDRAYNLDNSAAYIPPTVYTDFDSVRELIRRPSHIVNDILKKELNQDFNIIAKNVNDDKYKLDFSVDEAVEGIEVLEEIARCSPFYYLTSMHDNTPYLVGLKNIYQESDVDKRINVNQILKYKYNKTSKSDIATKAKVKYGYDYNKQEYTQETDYVSHDDENILFYDASLKEMYFDRYDIEDENAYEHVLEAKYIQDSVTAEMLAKHIFESHKNQHLTVDFELSLKDGLDLQVGDTISFVDNNGNLTNINNTKPYGLDMSITNMIIDQAVLPYFMVTSIVKDLSKLKIQVTQLHELAPSAYDDWQVQNEIYIPNIAPTIQAEQLSNDYLLVGEYFLLNVYADDPDGIIANVEATLETRVGAQVIFTQTSDLTFNPSANAYRLTLQATGDIFNQIAEDSYETTYNIKAFDDDGDASNQITGSFSVNYVNEPPIANIKVDDVVAPSVNPLYFEQFPVTINADTVTTIDWSNSYDGNQIGQGISISPSGDTLLNGIKSFEVNIEGDASNIVYNQAYADNNFNFPTSVEITSESLPIGSAFGEITATITITDRYDDTTTAIVKYLVRPEQPILYAKPRVLMNTYTTAGFITLEPSIQQGTTTYYNVSPFVPNEIVVLSFGIDLVDELGNIVEQLQADNYVATNISQSSSDTGDLSNFEADEYSMACSGFYPSLMFNQNPVVRIDAYIRANDDNDTEYAGQNIIVRLYQYE